MVRCRYGHLFPMLPGLVASAWLERKPKEYGIPERVTRMAGELSLARVPQESFDFSLRDDFVAAGRGTSQQTA